MSSNLLVHFVLVAKADDGVLATSRKTLDEQSKSFLRCLHESATHGPTPVHHEHKVEITSIHCQSIGLFILSNLQLFLRFFWLESRCDDCGHCHLIRIRRVVLYEETRLQHVISLVEYPHIAFGRFVGLRNFHLVDSLLLLVGSGRSIRGTEVSDSLVRGSQDFNLIRE